jgi:hypothetical protein
MAKNLEARPLLDSEEPKAAPAKTETELRLEALEAWIRDNKGDLRQVVKLVLGK